jgi:hypothetical protein
MHATPVCRQVEQQTPQEHRLARSAAGVNPLAAVVDWKTIRLGRTWAVGSAPGQGISFRRPTVRFVDHARCNVGIDFGVRVTMRAQDLARVLAQERRRARRIGREARVVGLLGLPSRSA